MPLYRPTSTVGSPANISTSGGTAGFYGVTPTARPTTYTLTYAATTRTHAAVTSAAVSTAAATAVTPFGYATAAQADALPVAINAVEADLVVAKNLLNSVIGDLKLVGLLQ